MGKQIETTLSHNSGHSPATSGCARSATNHVSKKTTGSSPSVADDAALPRYVHAP